MRLQVTQQRRFWWFISSLITVIGIIAMIISWRQIGTPLRPALDFVGGTRLQIELDCTKPSICDQPVNLDDVRSVLNEQNLGGSSVQIIGESRHGLVIRSSSLDVQQRNQLEMSLQEKIGQFDAAKTKIDTVGPTLGARLFRSGAWALVLSFLGIIVYLTFRFQLDYAMFAIVALLHDVMITVSVFAVLGIGWGIEVDSLFLVALLTIVGFSVNDTVVIYDRVRETIELNPGQHIRQIVDDAVNDTLGRSLNTTLTTLLPLVAILIFGGETLKFFSLALIVGFIAGAYSSIFIATTLLALWREVRGQAIVSPAIIIESNSDT